MNADEAIKAIKDGKRVTHQLFADDEWIEMNKHGMYIFEDGTTCTPERFWGSRFGVSWNTGWYIKTQN